MKRRTPDADACDQPVVLDSRRIAPPTLISEKARTFLRERATTPAIGTLPPVTDVAEWRRLIATMNARLLDQQNALAARIAPDVPVARNVRAGVPTFEAAPREDDVLDSRDIVLFLHGGCLVLGGGDCVGPATAMAAAASGRRTIGVDFRNPPDHPFPTALDDCSAVYRELIEHQDPARIALTARSGGCNLAVGLVLGLLERRLPLPAAVALFTPELDLAEGGDSFATLMGLDVVLNASLTPFSELYAGGRDLADPALSPLRAAIPAGFPPAFLQSGTRDLFLSNTVLMHRNLRRAGIDAELHVWESMPHGGFGGETAEDAEIAAEYRAFLQKHLPGAEA